MSVIRVFHGKSNPYTVLSNEVLDDTNLSNGAVGLWAKCMRRPDGWQFHISQMVKDGQEGKTALYRQIKELILNGYCLRIAIRKEENRKKMLFASVDYVFFEKKISQADKLEFLQEFQKIYPQSGFLDTDNPNADNQPILNTNSIASTDCLENNSSLKVPTEPAPVGAMSAKADEIDNSPPIKKLNLSKSPEVVQLATEMLEEMRAIKPDYKQPPSTAAIETQIDLMIRRDTRKQQEIIDVFRWALSDDFWRDKMFKPNPAKYLRDKYDQLHLRMTTRLPDKNEKKRSNQTPDGKTKPKPEMDNILK